MSPDERLSKSIAITEDYGDTWRILITLPEELAGRPYVARFSRTTNARSDPTATPLTITPHETNPAQFYVSGLATISGTFRVWATDGDTPTILTGKLAVR